MAKTLQGDEKILTKIKAALDIANHPNTTLEEKEAALLAVQRLMQNNHIEHHRVESFNAEGKKIEENVEEDEIFYDEMYEAYLLHYIAMNNFCKVILKGKERINGYDEKCESMIKPGDIKDKMSIIGEPTNINMCLYLYSFFRHAILQLSVDKYTGFLIEMQVKELGIKVPNNHKTKFIANYIAGCVEGIKKKMEDQKAQACADSSVLTGLIRVKDNAVGEYVGRKYGRLGSSNASMSGNTGSSAYGDGMKDGYGLGASKPIGGGRNLIG